MSPVTGTSDDTVRSSRLRLATGSSTAVFDLDDGARLSSLVLDGHELLVEDDGRGDVWWGGFWMAPWSGRLPGGVLEHDGRTAHLPVDWFPHALHGLVRKQPWTAAGTDLLTTRFPDSWPFGGEASLRPRLRDDGLSLRLEATAHDRSMPCSLGWHPWFRRVLSNAAVEVRLKQHVVVAEPHDHDVRLPDVTLVWPDAGSLTITSSGGVFHLYSGDRRGLSVEPQTETVGAPDKVLAPGESMTLDIDLSWVPA